MRRFVVSLTSAERDAILEALGFRMAGEMNATEGVAQRRKTYESAETKVSKAQFQKINDGSGFKRHFSQEEKFEIEKLRKALLKRQTAPG